MKKQLNETRRMQQLAGILKEANALDPIAPSWGDYEGYETLLEEYFDIYEITDAKSFKEELDNGDLMNNLAFDIAKRADFRGSMNDLANNRDANLFYNNLAKEFMIQYAKDTFLIRR